MTKVLTTSMGIIAVLVITALAVIGTTSTSAQAQNTQATCWDRWIGHYSSYSTTSNINNNAGYEGIELHNGDNKIMHWFSKKDTLHYFYTNGVEECDKNGGYRLSWVQVNNVWTKTTTSINFTPYTKQTSTPPINTGTRPITTNTGTNTGTTGTTRTGTGTYSNGEKYTYKAYLRADGTRERIAYYRTDGTLREIYYLRANETTEALALYGTDETLEGIVYYKTDGTIKIRIVGYRADGSIERIGYYRANGETFERVVYYQADGTTIQQTHYYRADKTKEKTIFANGVVWYYEADGTTRRNTGTQGNNNACILWVNSRNGRTYITSYTSISYATGLTLTQGGWSATRAAETMLAVERDNLGKYEYACFLKELRAITTYPNAWHELKKIRGGAVSEYQAWQRKYGIID